MAMQRKKEGEAVATTQGWFQSAVVCVQTLMVPCVEVCFRVGALCSMPFNASAFVPVDFHAEMCVSMSGFVFLCVE